jgi:hypothetical protein
MYKELLNFSYFVCILEWKLVCFSRYGRDFRIYVKGVDEHEPLGTETGNADRETLSSGLYDC